MLKISRVDRIRASTRTTNAGSPRRSAPGVYHFSPPYSLTRQCAAELFEFRILGLGGYEDGDAGIGVFPQLEEVLVSGAALDVLTG